MLCAVDYIFNLLCAFNCLQPMKKFVFSVASRATGRLQIKPSGSGDENGMNPFSAYDVRAEIQYKWNYVYAFLPSQTYQLMRCIAWARLLGSLSKRYTIWSKMAKGKSPKPPLFQYQHSIVWKTYFKYQPSKGEGTKHAKTKLYIFMYKVDNKTYQGGWEKGRRWVKMKSVFTQWKCERMISNRYSPRFHTSSTP